MYKTGTYYLNSALVLILSFVINLKTSSQTIDIKPYSPIPKPSLTLGYSYLNFNYEGSEIATIPLEFNNPIFKLNLQVPVGDGSKNWSYLKISFATGAMSDIHYGNNTYDNKIFFFEFLSWYHFLKLDSRNIQFLISLPLIFSTDILTVTSTLDSKKNKIGSFDFGAGIGVHFNSLILKKIMCELRSMPIITMSSKTKEKKLIPEFSIAINSDITFNWERVIFDRIGFILGASYKFQNKPMYVEEFFTESDVKWHKFKYSQPEIRFGLNW